MISVDLPALGGPDGDKPSGEGSRLGSGKLMPQVRSDDRNG
jgi:hypothetical protein